MITLKTLPQATAQEVFDQVARHLLTQNERCETAPEMYHNACCYRYNDLKCAAGCLIGDNEYHLEMEDANWISLVELNFVPPHHEPLISDLQIVHDEAPIKNWPKRLARLAIKYKLSDEVLNDFRS